MISTIHLSAKQFLDKLGSLVIWETSLSSGSNERLQAEPASVSLLNMTLV